MFLRCFAADTNGDTVCQVAWIDTVVREVAVVGARESRVTGVLDDLDGCRFRFNRFDEVQDKDRRLLAGEDIEVDRDFGRFLSQLVLACLGSET